MSRSHSSDTAWARWWRSSWRGCCGGAIGRCRACWWLRARARRSSGAGMCRGPEPGDAEFVEALRQLQGTPREVLDNPTLLQLILPALREDAAIYRNYIYAEEPPLDCPIRAYGGAEDPNVHRQHLEGWAAETTATFCRASISRRALLPADSTSGVSGGTGAGLDRVSAAAHFVRSYTPYLCTGCAISHVSTALVGSVIASRRIA